MQPRHPPASPPPIITLDEGSPVPKYQQIADQVRALVASGALAPGAAIPSVRQLATDLGINTNTVLAAYRGLEAENIVVLRRGSRAIIHPRLASAAIPAPHDYDRIRALLSRVRVEATLAGLTMDQLSALAGEVFGSPGSSLADQPGVLKEGHHAQ
jgi:DNA-binding transcriptional regulator YhcF (GntR family)